jgi:6-phosphogluconate dehydrogenase
MNIGVIGLGRMGISIVDRLIKAGHTVVGFDSNEKTCQEATKIGVSKTSSLQELAKTNHIFWLMVPAGEIVDNVIDELKVHLKPGDIIIDGGNSNFNDTIKRFKKLGKSSIHLLDCGTSGGLYGRKIGFSLMIGGDESIFKKVEKLFMAIAAPNGYGYMGPAGAGHYVKMIHNGIEYALLQSYAEGLHLLKEGHYKNLDLEKITSVWNNGSVIRSWIVDLLQKIFSQDQELHDISGTIEENFTGQWTLKEAKKQKIPIDLIERSLQIRAWSRKSGGNYGTKLVAMLRNKFGGHSIKLATKVKKEKK